MTDDTRTPELSAPTRLSDKRITNFLHALALAEALRQHRQGLPMAVTASAIVGARDVYTPAPTAISTCTQSTLDPDRLIVVDSNESKGGTPPSDLKQNYVDTYCHPSKLVKIQKEKANDQTEGLLTGATPPYIISDKTGLKLVADNRQRTKTRSTAALTAVDSALKKSDRDNEELSGIADVIFPLDYNNYDRPTSELERLAKNYQLSWSQYERTRENRTAFYKLKAQFKQELKRHG